MRWIKLLLEPVAFAAPEREYSMGFSKGFCGVLRNQNLWQNRSNVLRRTSALGKSFAVERDTCGPHCVLLSFFAARRGRVSL
jgi:hypothetical protein